MVHYVVQQECYNKRHRIYMQVYTLIRNLLPLFETQCILFNLLLLCAIFIKMVCLMGQLLKKSHQFTNKRLRSLVICIWHCVRECITDAKLTCIQCITEIDGLSVNDLLTTQKNCKLGIWNAFAGHDSLTKNSKWQTVMSSGEGQRST